MKALVLVVERLEVEDKPHICKMERPILKSFQEIEKLRKANHIIVNAFELVSDMIEPGITTGAIDSAVESLIRSYGAIPTFKGYPSHNRRVKPFPASICASINEEVVHGIPSNERYLEDGDIISIDVGTKLDGFCGDATRTFFVGNVSSEARKLSDVCKKSLDEAIALLKPGVILREICAKIQEVVESEGMSVVKQFVGHGVGRDMHEPPQVPNYVSNTLSGLDIELPVGTVLAIEPMVNIGRSEVQMKKDGWTVVTKDKSLSVHWEHSVAITESGCSVLSEI